MPQSSNTKKLDEIIIDQPVPGIEKIVLGEGSAELGFGNFILNERGAKGSSNIALGYKVSAQHHETGWQTQLPPPLGTNAREQIRDNYAMAQDPRDSFSVNIFKPIGGRIDFARARGIPGYIEFHRFYKTPQIDNYYRSTSAITSLYFGFDDFIYEPQRFLNSSYGIYQGPNVRTEFVAELKIRFTIGTNALKYERLAKYAIFLTKDEMVFKFSKDYNPDTASEILDRILFEIYNLSKQECNVDIDNLIKLRQRCHHLLWLSYHRIAELRPTNINHSSARYNATHLVDLHLCYAVYNKDPELIEITLKNFANPNVLFDGIPLLTFFILHWIIDVHKVSNKIFFETLTLLIRYGADLSLSHGSGQSIEELLLYLAVNNCNQMIIVKRCCLLLEFLANLSMRDRKAYIPTINIGLDSDYMKAQPLFAIVKSNIDANIITMLKKLVVHKTISHVYALKCYHNQLELMILRNNKVAYGQHSLNIHTIRAPEVSMQQKKILYAIFTDNFEGWENDTEKEDYFADLFKNKDAIIGILSLNDTPIAFTVWQTKISQQRPMTILHYLKLIAANQETKNFPRLMSVIQFRTCLALQQLFTAFEVITFCDVVSPIFLQMLEAFVTTYKYNISYIHQISQDIKHILETDDINYEDGQYYTPETLRPKMTDTDTSTDTALHNPARRQYEQKLKRNKSLLVMFKASQIEFNKTIRAAVNPDDIETVIENQKIKLLTKLPQNMLDILHPQMRLKSRL